MADFTSSTGLRDIIAGHLENDYFWMTLHDDTGGFLPGDTYSVGIRGELATEFGYTQGGAAVTMVATDGVIDGDDAVWTASGGSIGPASYAALWCNTSNTIVGAKLVSVKDSSDTPQTATDGNTMTAAITDPITIPTPS